MALHFLEADAGAAGIGDLVALTGAEAHHAAAVRRVRRGERVTVTDGRGAWLHGECAEVEQGRVAILVTDRRMIAAPEPRIVLAQALAKGDRDELAVQAATELGVAAILPWQAARSVSRWQGQKAEKGRARWAAIVREAAKQAHRAWLPEVLPIASTAQLAAHAASARTLVLEPTAKAQLSTASLGGEVRDVVLVVGPEGGVAPEELAALVEAGAAGVRLGDTVLRTSTAGPAAIAVLNVALGRW